MVGEWTIAYRLHLCNMCNCNEKLILFTLEGLDILEEYIKAIRFYYITLFYTFLYALIVLLYFV
jgi:hypothetical protein